MIATMIAAFCMVFVEMEPSSIGRSLSITIARSFIWKLNSSKTEKALLKAYASRNASAIFISPGVVTLMLS